MHALDSGLHKRSSLGVETKAVDELLNVTRVGLLQPKHVTFRLTDPSFLPGLHELLLADEAVRFECFRKSHSLPWKESVERSHNKHIFSILLVHGQFAIVEMNCVLNDSGIQKATIVRNHQQSLVKVVFQIMLQPKLALKVQTVLRRQSER